MSSAGTLHATVHGVVALQRRADDTYGEPLQTALAVAALTAHADDYHGEARTAIAAMTRRWNDRRPGVSGRDVAAVSLLARCASDLGVREPGAEHLAQGLSTELLQRAMRLAPLHLALVAHSWHGLTAAEPWPWPALRTRLADAPSAGVDAGLVGYARALSSDRLDAGLLIQDLLTAVAGEADLSERCVLLWLLDQGLLAVRGEIGADDRGLRYLVERRGVLEGRLAAEIDRENFDEPPLETEFDPEGRDGLLGLQRLGAFEAAILDWSLVERAEAGSSLSLSEAEALFGTRLAAAEGKARELDLRRVRQLAGTVVLLGLSVGSSAVLALRLADYRVGVSLGWGVTVFVLGLLAGAWMRSRGPDSAPSAEVWAVIATLLLVACYLLYDQARATPQTGNPLEYALGLLIPAVAVAVGVGAVRRTRRTTSARSSRDDRAP
jgi:hypothetical protein